MAFVQKLSSSKNAAASNPEKPLWCLPRMDVGSASLLSCLVTESRHYHALDRVAWRLSYVARVQILEWFYLTYVLRLLLLLCWACALVLVSMRIFSLPPLQHRRIDEEWLTCVKGLGFICLNVIIRIFTLQWTSLLNTHAHNNIYIDTTR